MAFRSDGDRFLACVDPADPAAAANLASAEVKPGFFAVEVVKLGLAIAAFDFPADPMLPILAFLLDGTMPCPAGAPGCLNPLPPLVALNGTLLDWDKCPTGRRFAIVTFKRFPSNSACTFEPIAASPSSTMRSKCPPQQSLVVLLDEEMDDEEMDDEDDEERPGMLGTAVAVVLPMLGSSYLSARMCSEPFRFKARLQKAKTRQHYSSSYKFMRKTDVMLSRLNPGRVATTRKWSAADASTVILHPAGCGPVGRTSVSHTLR